MTGVQTCALPIFSSIGWLAVPGGCVALHIRCVTGNELVHSTARSAVARSMIVGKGTKLWRSIRLGRFLRKLHFVFRNAYDCIVLLCGISYNGMKIDECKNISRKDAEAQRTVLGGFAPLRDPNVMEAPCVNRSTARRTDYTFT